MLTENHMHTMQVTQLKIEYPCYTHESVDHIIHIYFGISSTYLKAIQHSSHKVYLKFHYINLTFFSPMAGNHTSYILERGEPQHESNENVRYIKPFLFVRSVFLQSHEKQRHLLELSCMSSQSLEVTQCYRVALHAHIPGFDPNQ